MIKNENALLIEQGARLMKLGLQVEAAREKLRRLVEQNVPYTDRRMREALQSFEKLDAEWKALEREHLALRANHFV